jgi:uncharacterized membrane protein YkvA (DUF1232 family)
MVRAAEDGTMSESLAKYLDVFAGWLRTLGEDAEKLGGLLEGEGVAQPARESIAGGLNYLFKSLDLIPDGIDDIGYLDDAFVLRVAADLAVSGEGDTSPEKLKLLSAASPTTATCSASSSARTTCASRPT